MTNSAALLTDLITEFESSLTSWKGKPNVLLPSAGQFYRLGLVLSDLVDHLSENQTELLQVYRTLLEQVPQSHLRSVLEDLHEAFCKILETFLDEPVSSESTVNRDAELALKSMHGLYRTNAEILLLAAKGAPIAGWSMQKIQLLHSVYEKLTSQVDNDTAKVQEEHLLSLLAAFLQDPTLDFETLLPAINVLQDKPDRYTKSAWERLISLQSSNPQWKEQMMSRFVEIEQQDYLSSMFTVEDDDDKDSPMTQTSKPNNSQQQERTDSRSMSESKSSTTSPQDSIQRLVLQVKNLFPHLGDGYIETALSQYHGDVEHTIGALVEAQENPASLPVTLQRLDPKLPGRWKGPTTSQSKAEEEEARRVTQETVRAMERQQEDEARALEVFRVTSVPKHDEYNDDYDDLYDEVDGFMSNDQGLYDDFETVRTYNKMLKQVEQDQAFWVSYLRLLSWCALLTVGSMECLFSIELSLFGP
jgi:hypothetical protein